MNKEKSVVVLYASGEEETLESIPSLETMQKIVGGFIEFVRVLPLEESIATRNKLTYMVVNEMGRLIPLPRNPKATEIYHHLTRTQFRDSGDPFRSAKEEYNKSIPPNTKVFYSVPEDDIPFIAGDVIYFKGYTIGELQDVM